MPHTVHHSQSPTKLVHKPHAIAATPSNIRCPNDAAVIATSPMNGGEDGAQDLRLPPVVFPSISLWSVNQPKAFVASKICLLWLPIFFRGEYVGD